MMIAIDAPFNLLHPLSPQAEVEHPANIGLQAVYLQF
jgi:hypothetical protein